MNFVTKVFLSKHVLKSSLKPFALERNHKKMTKNIAGRKVFLTLHYVDAT